MKDYCFVAQPFDKAMFDDRYCDIIEPVVNACGLACYRVDWDSSAEVPVRIMEERIAQASLIIVEITNDNPNVWYELGYASALNKPIIMVCSDERQPPYPFDIQHKNILTYCTKSPRDFERYRQDLTRAIRARYKGTEDASHPVVLTEEEMLLLKFIARDQKNIHAITPEEKILRSRMDQDMVLDCLRALTSGGYLEYIYSTDGQDSYYHVTEKAEKLLFRR